MLGNIHFLGDHFSPSLYVLSPLFLIFNSPSILLIEQSAALTGAGFLVFLISRSEKISTFGSYIIAFAFLIFAGVENALVTDWHTEPTAAFFILLFIYLFFFKKKIFLGILAFLFFLGLKESNALSLVICLVPLYVIRKNDRKKIIILAVFALIWFYIAIKVAIPFFSHAPYLYSPTFPASPFEYISQFINTQEKRSLIFNSFISFGLLPLLSPSFLITIFGELGMRLIPTKSYFQSFTLGMHYNVLLGVFLTLGSMYGIANQKKGRIQRYLLFLLLLSSLFAAKKITMSPFTLISNKVFWKEWSKQTQLFKMLSYVPKSGSIMSQNNILPHLIERKEQIFLLSNDYIKLNPDTIVIDYSPEQNVNNYYSGEISEFAQVTILKNNLEKNSTYKLLKTPYESLFIFVKNSRSF